MIIGYSWVDRRLFRGGGRERQRGLVGGRRGPLHGRVDRVRRDGRAPMAHRHAPLRQIAQQPQVLARPSARDRGQELLAQVPDLRHEYLPHGSKTAHVLLAHASVSRGRRLRRVVGLRATVVVRQVG